MALKIKRGEGAPAVTLAEGEPYLDKTNGHLYVGDGSTNQKFVKDNGVKVYRALLSQAGTDAPVATKVFENSLGVSPSFSREDVGSYKITIAGITINNTFLQLVKADGVMLEDDDWYLFGGVNNGYIVLKLYSSSNALIDGGATAYIEILVYPES